MAIFGSNQKIEAQFKKIYKSRIIKTGMSELLRDIDKDFTNYDHTSLLSKAKLESSASQVKEWVEKLSDAASSIDKIFKKKIDWTPAEKTFLEKLIKEVKEDASALSQMLEKAEKNNKVTSTTEESLLKAQANVLTKKIPSWENGTKDILEMVEKYESYVVTQTKLVNELIKPPVDKLDYEVMETRLESLLKLMKDNGEKTSNQIKSDIKRDIEPLHKLTKICINNKQAQELDKKILDKKTSIIDVIDNLDEKMLICKNKIWALQEKMTQSLKN